MTSYIHFNIIRFILFYYLILFLELQNYFINIKSYNIKIYVRCQEFQNIRYPDITEI